MFSLMMTVEHLAAEHPRALSDAAFEALLLGIARGEREAFDAFYRASDKILYAYALSLTRNHHDAQDAMMETYLKIRAAAHLYQPQGKPLAWVFTIARNLIRSQQRAAARETPLSDVAEEHLPFDEAAHTDEAIVLRAALRCLSEEERQIVVLHAVSGLKHRELSALLELPLSTVLSKYARALTKLKKHLTEQEVTLHG